MFLISLLLAIAAGAQNPNINGELSFSKSQSLLEGPRDTSSIGIDSLSLSSGFFVSPSTFVHLELLGEQGDEGTEVYFGEVYTKLINDSLLPIEVGAGNLYYIYGILTGQEALYPLRPAYYGDLLVTDRGLDLGGFVKVGLLENFYLAAGLYSGQSLRQGDGLRQEAEVSPRVFTASYETDIVQAKLHSVQRKYRDEPRFEAQGLSLKASPLKLTNTKLDFEPFAELWQLSYTRDDGFDRKAQTQLIGNLTSFFGFFHRILLSEENWSGDTALKTNYHLQGLGYKINEHLKLEYQSVWSQESQSSFKLLNTHEDIYSLYVSF